MVVFFWFGEQSDNQNWAEYAKGSPENLPVLPDLL